MTKTHANPSAMIEKLRQVKALIDTLGTEIQTALSDLEGASEADLDLLIPVLYDVTQDLAWAHLERERRRAHRKKGALTASSHKGGEA